MLRQARSAGWFPTDAVLTFKETPYPGKTDEPSLAYHWFPVPAGDNLYSLTPTQTCWPRLALPTADWSGPSRDLIANDVIRDPGVIGRWSVYPETLGMVTDLSLSTETLGFLLNGDNENMDANNATCRSKIDDIQLTVTYTIPTSTATAPSTPTPSSRLPGTTVITAVNPGDCAACTALVITPTPTPSRQPAAYHDPTPEAGTGWPQLTIATQGEAVRSLQYLLQQSGATLSVSGVDGKFGQETLQAVIAFQKAQGIASDGVVGQKTWLALIVTVQQGSQGAAVRAVQSQLKSRGQAVTVDGNFGGQTDSAVRAYQQAHGLTVDGQVGPQTWKALLTVP
jgi:phage gp46-like protein